MNKFLDKFIKHYTKNPGVILFFKIGVYCAAICLIYIVGRATGAFVHSLVG